MLEKPVKKSSNRYWLVSTFCLGVMALVSLDVAASSAMTIGGMASQITKSFSNLAKLITAGSYLAGLGFAIGAIMKFKAHKDNPTQITIGQPIGLLFVAAALLFLPSILGVTGVTIFGAGGSKTAGPTGTIFTTQ